IIQLIEQGAIRENQVPITAELVALFVDLSAQLTNETGTPKFAMPFFHLQGEKFWHLRTHYGMEIALTSSSSFRSFSQLKEVVAYGYFDAELWGLLAHSETRNVLRVALLQRYFPVKIE